MHSPGRNGAVNQSTNLIPAIQKQPLPSPNNQINQTNLNKSLSNSANILPTIDTISNVDYYQYQQQLSPPYYHSHTQSFGKLSAMPPTAVPSSAASVAVSHATHSHGTQLRRTASNASSNYVEIISNDMSPTSPMHPTDAGHYQNLTPTVSTNSNGVSDIHVESPKNVTVVQPAKFQPYKEVTKPFEMSDFYKYSTKFRQKGSGGTGGTTNSPNTSITSNVDQNSPQLPPKNMNMMQHRATANNTPTIPTPYTIRYH